MKTHELEKLLGINKRTLIYYEEEGLIHPLREENNFRNYQQEDIDKVRLIMLLRNMEVSIDELKQIFNGNLSIRQALETKKKYIQKSKDRLDNIEKDIKNYIKRYKVNIVFELDDSNESSYQTLNIIDKQFLFNDIVIEFDDVVSISLSMCSSMGENGLIFHILQYYVDLDITTNNDIYSFQIMNNSMITNMLDILKDNNLKLIDELNLYDIYHKYSDPVSLRNYINRNFKSWAKKYNLDNPRDNPLSIRKENLMNPLNEFKNTRK